MDLVAPATVVVIVCSVCTVLGLVSWVVSAMYRSVL